MATGINVQCVIRAWNAQIKIARFQNFQGVFLCMKIRYIMFLSCWPLSGDESSIPTVNQSVVSYPIGNDEPGLIILYAVSSKPRDSALNISRMFSKLMYYVNSCFGYKLYLISTQRWQFWPIVGHADIGSQCVRTSVPQRCVHLCKRHWLVEVRFVRHVELQQINKYIKRTFRLGWYIIKYDPE